MSKGLKFRASIEVDDNFIKLVRKCKLLEVRICCIERCSIIDFELSKNGKKDGPDMRVSMNMGKGEFEKCIKAIDKIEFASKEKVEVFSVGRATPFMMFNVKEDGLNHA